MSLFQKKPAHETTELSKRFNLIGRVGQGSMSKVWRAEDYVSGRPCAVKLLDKEKTQRFENRFKGLDKPTEGEIAISLRHPNIVQTFEIGHTPEGEMFLVMEYVEGCGLGLLVDLQSDRMREHRLRYMIQIGEALMYFHKNDWIHRDICPRNIMVTEDDHIKLIDFGLTVPNTPPYRKPGNRTGTANYMAPELIKRQPTDQRIDVFSLAVTCYEMYAKRHPWDAAMTIDAVLQHINKAPIPLPELVPRVDSEVAEIIMKGLEANPADRWQCVDEMVEELRRVERRLVREAHAWRKQQDNSKKSGSATEADKAGGESIEMPAVGPEDSRTEHGQASEPSESTKSGRKRRKKKRRKNALSDDDIAAALAGDDGSTGFSNPSMPAASSDSTPAEGGSVADDDDDDEMLSLD